MALPTTRDLINLHLSSANNLARTEILTGLTAPHRQIVTLVQRRSDQLALEEAEIAEIAIQADALNARINANPAWGMF